MIRVKVGSVEVRTDADLTVKQIHRLLAAAAGYAILVGPSVEPEPDRPPLGFSAQVERLPEDFGGTDYDDEE